jgi:hypothetical protein
MPDFHVSNTTGLKELDDFGKLDLSSWLKDNWADGEYVFISLKSDPINITGGATRLFRFSTEESTWNAGRTDAKLDITVIPEPASALFFFAGAGALAFIRRRLRALK